MNKKSADDEFDEDDEEERDAYAAKIRQKLGAAKSKMLGFDSDDNDDDGESAVNTSLQPATQKQQPQRPAQIGSLASTTEITSGPTEDVSTGTGRYQRITDDDNDTTDPMLVVKENDSDSNHDDDADGDLDEDDLVDLVAERMQEKRDREEREKQARLQNGLTSELARSRCRRSALFLRFCARIYFSLSVNWSSLPMVVFFLCSTIVGSICNSSRSSSKARKAL